MRLFIKLFISPTLITLGLTATLSALPPCYAQNQYDKSTLLSGITNIKSRQLSTLTQIQADIDKALQSINEITMSPTATKETTRAYKQTEEKIGELRKQYYEQKLRLQVLDQLMFQADNYYHGQELSGFLHNSLQQMAKRNITSDEGSLWKFMNYAAIALKNLPEQHEDPLAFFEGYMQSSSVSHPLRADQYSSSRDYTNGRENYTAKTTSRDQVGDKIPVSSN